MNNKRVAQQILKNNKGSTILTVVMVSAVMAIGFGFLADRLINQKKLSLNLSSNIGYNLALRSITDFAKYQLKLRSCFGNDMKLETGVNCAGNYTHPKSISRLVLPLKFAEKLLEYKNNIKYAGMISGTFPASNKAVDMLLNSFEVVTDISAITESHPLYKITKNLKGDKDVRKIRIKYSVDQDIELPRVSDEVYINILTQLLNSKNEVIQNGASPAAELLRVYVSPREVNYFSLIVRGNVVIGGTSANLADGNLVIPQTSNPKAVGVSFYSPIFANRDIIFANKASYTPAVFYDVVVLGSGIVSESNGGAKTTTPYIINKPMGEASSWSQTKIFGGLQKGYESDSKLDMGLEVIAGATSSSASAANNALTDRCIAISNSEKFREDTPKSRLTGKNDTPFDNPNATLNSAPSYARQYLLSFSEDSDTKLHKRFKPTTTSDLESGVVLPSNSKSDGLAEIDYDFSKDANGASIDLSKSQVPLSAEIKWNNTILKVPLLERSAGSPATADYKLEVKLRIYKESVKESLLADTQEEIIELNKKIAPLTDDIEPLQVKIKGVGTAAQLAGWNTELNDKIAARAVFLADRTKLENKVTLINNLINNPAKLTFTVSNYSYNGKVQPHFRKLNIVIDDLNKLVDPMNGTKHPIDYIKLTAYDFICGSRCADENRKLQQTFLYEFTPAENPLCSSYAYDKLFIKNPTNPTACNVLNNGTPAKETEDFASELELCEKGNNSLAGYNSSQFEQYFTDNSAGGWRFKIKPPSDTHKVLEDISIAAGAPDAVKSEALWEACTVPSEVNRVVGNYFCKKLVISSRTTPLEMIGTFIVTDKLEISPTAMDKGVSFYSIHHPRALEILKQANILRKSNGSSCATLSKPYWHPDPGLTVLSDRIKCSTLSVLRGTGEKYPFRWTSVDADCVFLPTNPTDTTCLKKIRNYLYKDLERTYGYKE
jgi:hypothetical protein